MRAPSGLVDIGANLTNKAFRRDLPEVLARAQRARVDTVIITGTSVQASEDARRLVTSAGRAGPRLKSTAGIHPHHASSFGPLALSSLRELTATPEVVAVGECGLDWHRMLSPRAAQLRCFEAQLDLASETNLPVFMHERRAHDDFCAVLKNHRRRLKRGVVHCFTGTRRELDAYLDLDLYIGITGWICDERRGLHLADLVPSIPRERLMIETDAPYLLPRDMRPPPADGRNEPAFLPHVLEALARARGEPSAAVAAATSAAAEAFFFSE